MCAKAPSIVGETPAPTDPAPAGLSRQDLELAGLRLVDLVDDEKWRLKQIVALVKAIGTLLPDEKELRHGAAFKDRGEDCPEACARMEVFHGILNTLVLLEGVQYWAETGEAYVECDVDTVLQKLGLPTSCGELAATGDAA